MEFGEELVTVSQADQVQELPWDRIVKLIRTKHMVIIYTDRIHAYLLPVSVVGERMEEFAALVRKDLPKER